MIEKFSLAEKQLCKPIVEDAKLPSDMSFMNKKQYCDYLALSLELFLRLRVEHQASLNQ